MTAPARNTSTAVQRRQSTTVQQITAKDQLAHLTTERAKRLIEPMLAQGVTYERILSEAYFAIQKDPKLLDCTPESLITAVAQCTAWDLEIGIKAHLVPFNVKVKVRGDDGRETEQWQTRCQAIRDYKGDADLVVRCGAARYVDAHNVYANEVFEYELGTSPFIKHQPIMDPEKRGRLIGAYAVAKVNAHDIKIAVLSREEIDEVRIKYSKSWKDHWVNDKKVPYTLEEIRWYGPKTCVHRVVKLLPTNPRLAKVLAMFASEERLFDDPTAVTDPRVEIGGGEPVHDLARQSRQLMPGMKSDAPYETDAAAPQQSPREVPSETVPRVTDGQRATASHAAQMADPFADEAPDDAEQDLPFDAPAAPARELLACEAYVIPAGLGPRSGVQLAELSTDDLTALSKWASKPSALKNYPDLAHNCEALLDARRLGEAPEPTA
jgi:recombination protein RecT